MKPKEMHAAETLLMVDASMPRMLGHGIKGVARGIKRRRGMKCVCMLTSRI